MAPQRIDLSPDALRRLFDELDERDYLLIDVRQPHEYEEGHLPGARLMPLLEFEARLFDLPADRCLVLYCGSGSRSRMAAMLAEEAEAVQAPIYHLEGGTAAWDGRTVDELPKIEVFGADDGPDALMSRAMDLEKGALLFYRRLGERYPDAPFAPVLRRLEQAEEGHARLVHRFWSRLNPDAPPFEEHFRALAGDILEGGGSLDDAVERIGAVTTRRCLTVLEFALGIECRAFDLYRHMGDTASDAAAREAFYGIAQAEKNHMKQLAAALEGCGDAP